MISKRGWKLVILPYVISIFPNESIVGNRCMDTLQREVALSNTCTWGFKQKRYGGTKLSTLFYRDEKIGCMTNIRKIRHIRLTVADLGYSILRRSQMFLDDGELVNSWRVSLRYPFPGIRDENCQGKGAGTGTAAYSSAEEVAQAIASLDGCGALKGMGWVQFLIDPLPDGMDFITW